MIACPAARGAAQRVELVLGIDLETIGASRPVAGGVQRDGAGGIAVAHAFDQAAAFRRCGLPRGVQDLSAQLREQGQPACHGEPFLTWRMSP